MDSRLRVLVGQGCRHDRGASAPKMTERYSHLSPKVKLDAVAVLDSRPSGPAAGEACRKAMRPTAP